MVQRNLGKILLSIHYICAFSIVSITVVSALNQISQILDVLLHFAEHGVQIQHGMVHSAAQEEKGLCERFLYK